MKIDYKNLIEYIDIKPSIDQLSENLFQLGHEHEIENGIFDMEFTPNRGDCLSVIGLLRDLSLFYDINKESQIYEKKINRFLIDFENHQPKSCSHISFLKIEIENEILPYKDNLKNYFDNLNVKKNNFFTDISNYISYEMGQPTHCYDASLVDDKISLNFVEGDFKFHTLFDKEITLQNKNLVFLKGENIINLAGIVGGKSTSCTKDTRSVIVECAYFNPEDIAGKSTKYDIQSEAAHKFERGVDPKCHELILRRFIKIVEDHATIKNVELFQKEYTEYKKNLIPIDVNRINKIIGIKVNEEQIKSYLLKIGFEIKNNIINVPSYRSDIKTHNDIAEEIARSIGYDNIKSKSINIPNTNNSNNTNIDKKESAIKNLLIDEGFYEVINNPFGPKSTNLTIKVDNPLDSNRKFLRTSLKQSLIENLLYNERRQKDSIKLFEVSNIYSSSGSNLFNKRRVIGIIASGKVGKNYIDFSKKINDDYLSSLIDSYTKNVIKIENIPRTSLVTKLKNKVYYIEIELNEIDSSILNYNRIYSLTKNFTKYIPISDFPSSTRDLSFSVKNFSKLKPLEEFILNFTDQLLKEVFIFDYFHNERNSEIKVGFRFIFQSNKSTITELEVNNIIDAIIEQSINNFGVDIPGIN